MTEWPGLRPIATGMEDIDSDFNLALNPVKAMLGLNSNYSSVLM
jgi:hypothetical protein